MRRLRVITPEEQRILDGGAVDKAAYTARAVFTVDSEKLLERGRLISVRAHTRFAPFPRHAHSYIEIMYMCSGKTVHRINGGEPITVHAGELLFLGRGASHEIERAEYEDIAVNFIVLPQFFDTALERIGADNALGRFIANSVSRAGGSDFLLFRVADVLPVQNLVENLVWTLVNDTKNRRRITQNTMALLFLELLNCTDKLAASENEGDHSALVMTALREIEENYRTASLTDIAEKYGVTISYLSAAVHSTTGFTFKSLLRRKRMEKAAALLYFRELAVFEKAGETFNYAFRKLGLLHESQNIPRGFREVRFIEIAVFFGSVRMALRGDGAVLGGVDGLHIRVFKDDVLCEAVIAEGAQVEVEDDVIRQAAVDGEDGNFVLFVVPYGDGLDVGDIGEIDGIVLCGGEHRLERNAAAVFGGVEQRIINRLAPCGAVFFGHNGCDDVDELCHARHFYAVGVLHQRDEHEADE